MTDWVCLLLKAVYYYGHLIGLGNFEIDWRTGRVYTSPSSTIYALATNVSIFIVLLWQILEQTDPNVFFGNANKLLVAVILVLVGLRVASGLLTVHNRWHQRAKFIRLARKVLRLFLEKPQVKRMCRWRILIKFIIAIVTDLLQVAITWDSVGRVDCNQFIGMTLQFWMSTIINLAISQHYLVALFVRANYHLLNTELRRVVNESRILSYLPQRKGAFMTRCCSLADQLDNIAKLQSQLQSIVTELNAVAGAQGLMVYGGYYLSSIATYYLTYSILKNGLENLQLTVQAVILAFSWCFFYYLDAMINLFTMFNLLDDHKEMIRILQERTLFASGLDVRLEESFESFQFQVIRNPFQIEVMEIFSITRSSISAMYGSLVTHTIFLIQYDLEYF
ncbi:putative gustatory receptor 36a [Drosophila takahashii]|uniref:putative gustatory receptor 36a n=1 Tax=Drosophila takahashii TaxID=29030 RepID=UPI001CF85536|nr:putative gustatory receptor 36a [Drosophila takahashii]